MILPSAMLAAWRLGCMVCLFLVFILAGGAKLRPNAKFTASIAAFTGLPSQLVGHIARWLPRLELLLGLLVIVPLLAAWAAGAICILLVLFLLGALRAYRGGSVECGCFGNLVVEQSGRTELWRNILLLFMGGSVLLIHGSLVPDQWLLLIPVPGLLVLATFQIEVLRVAQEV